MKKYLLILLIFITLCSLTLNGYFWFRLGMVDSKNSSLTKDTWKFEFNSSGSDGTQTAMNQQSYSEFKRADDTLNRIYRQVLLEYKEDQLFIAELTKAEAAWLKYRDAHMEARFPGEDKRLLYGSVYPMIYSSEMAELTWARVRELNRWLEGVPEGDVGAGSFHFK